MIQVSIFQRDHRGQKLLGKKKMSIAAHDGEGEHVGEFVERQLVRNAPPEYAGTIIDRFFGEGVYAPDPEDD